MCRCGAPQLGSSSVQFEFVTEKPTRSVTGGCVACPKTTTSSGTLDCRRALPVFIRPTVCAANSNSAKADTAGKAEPTQRTPKEKTLPYRQTGRPTTEDRQIDKNKRRSSYLSVETETSTVQRDSLIEIETRVT